VRTLLLVLIFLAGCATAQPPAANVRNGRGYCAQCHEWHDDAEMRWPIEHRGKVYRFCDPNCRAAFERDPEKFLKDPKFNPPEQGTK
jgi:YHS domain-containing protein